MDEKILSMETEAELNPQHNLRVIHRLLQPGTTGGSSSSTSTSSSSPAPNNITGDDSSPGGRSSSSGTSSVGSLSSSASTSGNGGVESSSSTNNFRPIQQNNNNSSLLNNNNNISGGIRGNPAPAAAAPREGFLQMQHLRRISGSPVSGGSITGGGRSSDPTRVMDDGGLGMSSGVKDIGMGSMTSSSSEAHKSSLRPSRACPSPVSSIVGNALNQLQLKRSSSAPMINQLGVAPIKVPETQDVSPSSAVAPAISQLASVSGNSSGGTNKDSCLDIDAVSFANSFLSSLGGPRPRRFSASFSPQGSPGPAPNRVSQLRQENVTDWETASEKEFHGTVGIAQSWEDLSLDSMSMEVGTRRPSFSDQLFLSMPPASSAPSSPAASPRVLSRFSPSLSSPSPTRKSFTTRRSLSPIAVRPSVLAIGQGVKRKCDWDSGSSNQMDCSPQPAKRAGGLLSFNPIGSPSGNQSISSAHNSHSGFNYSLSGSSHQQFFPGLHNQSHHAISPFNPNNSSAPTNSMISMITNHVEDSPYSNETESSVSSIGACDSPFFRPVDSPLASVTASPEDSPHPPQSKM